MKIVLRREEVGGTGHMILKVSVCVATLDRMLRFKAAQHINNGNIIYSMHKQTKYPRQPLLHH